MTEHECNIINNCNHNKIVILTILWTAKEALSKVLKTGLTMDMKLFEINQLEERDIYRGSFTIFTQYQFLSFIIEDTVFTIVTPKKGNLHVIQNYIEEIL